MQNSVSFSKSEQLLNAPFDHCSAEEKQSENAVLADKELIHSICAKMIKVFDNREIQEKAVANMVQFAASEACYGFGYMGFSAYREKHCRNWSSPPFGDAKELPGIRIVQSVLSDMLSDE